MGNSQTLTCTPYQIRSSSPGLKKTKLTSHFAQSLLHFFSVRYAHQVGMTLVYTPLKPVTDKIHYTWGHGVGGHAWKMIHPQAMEFFGAKYFLYLHKYILFLVVLDSKL